MFSNHCPPVAWDLNAHWSGRSCAVTARPFCHGKEAIWKYASTSIVTLHQMGDGSPAMFISLVMLPPPAPVPSCTREGIPRNRGRDGETGQLVVIAPQNFPEVRNR